MNSVRLPPAQLRDTMSRLACFRAWDAATLARVAAYATMRVVPKNQQVVAKEDVPDTLYVVVSGQARLFLPLANGVERTISLISPGETFCESTLLADTPSPYSAAVCRDSHLLMIDGRAYLNELRASADLMRATLTRLALKFQSIVRDLELCSQHSSLGRVVGYLLNLTQGASNGPCEIQLPGRKRDIASKLGLSQETLSRGLSLLAHEGIIAMRGASIRVADPVRLRQIAANLCDKGHGIPAEFDGSQVANRVFA